MRTKLLSALLLASTALTGVASASPYIRDHRYEQPRITVQANARWEGGVHVTTRPSWMPQATYGYQVTAASNVIPYNYGNDPYVEGIARGEWYTLNPVVHFNAINSHGMNVKPQGRRMAALELQNLSGCIQISRVVITYANGSTVALTPARQLDAHSPNLRIDLGPQASWSGVQNVEILGGGDGTFRVLGA